MTKVTKHLYRRLSAESFYTENIIENDIYKSKKSEYVTIVPKPLEIFAGIRVESKNHVIKFISRIFKGKNQDSQETQLSNDDKCRDNDMDFNSNIQEKKTLIQIYKANHSHPMDLKKCLVSAQKQLKQQESQKEKERLNIRYQMQCLDSDIYEIDKKISKNKKSSDNDAAQKKLNELTQTREQLEKAKQEKTFEEDQAFYERVTLHKECKNLNYQIKIFDQNPQKINNDLIKSLQAIKKARANNTNIESISRTVEKLQIKCRNIINLSTTYDVRNDELLHNCQLINNDIEKNKIMEKDL